MRSSFMTLFCRKEKLEEKQSNLASFTNSYLINDWSDFYVILPEFAYQISFSSD